MRLKPIGNFMVSGLLVGLGVWAAVSLSCAVFDAQSVQAARQLAVEQTDYLDARLISIQNLHAAALERGDELMVEAMEEEKEFVEKRQDQFDAAISKIDSLFNEDGTMKQPEEVIDVLSPWLPAGAGTVVGLIVGVLRGLGKTKEANDAFASLVTALDEEKGDSNGLAEAMHASGTSLRSRLPSATKAKIAVVRNGA